MRRLTAGDMLDLAEAFRDYDTESLRVATLPVAPLFSDDGGYLGEQLQILEASEILDVFQGEADGVRPADVVVVVRSDDDGQRERSVDQLVTRGFDAPSRQAPGRIDTERHDGSLCPSSHRGRRHTRPLPRANPELRRRLGIGRERQPPHGHRRHRSRLRRRPIIPPTRCRRADPGRQGSRSWEHTSDRSHDDNGQIQMPRKPPKVSPELLKTPHRPTLLRLLTCQKALRR